MVKFKHQRERRLRQYILGRVWWQYLIAAVVIVLLGFIVERFVTQGTILGFRVRTIKSAAVVQRENSSGAPSGSQKGASLTNKACTEIPVEKISTALDDSLKVVGSFAADITDPHLVSSCIFSSKTTKLTASMLIREFIDQNKATKTVDALAKSQGVEEIPEKGEQAIYNTATNQLTVRKGSRVTTITVTKSSKAKFDNKASALKLADILP